MERFASAAPATHGFPQIPALSWTTSERGAEGILIGTSLIAALDLIPCFALSETNTCFSRLCAESRLCSVVACPLHLSIRSALLLTTSQPPLLFPPLSATSEKHSPRPALAFPQFALLCLSVPCFSLFSVAFHCLPLLSLAFLCLFLVCLAFPCFGWLCLVIPCYPCYPFIPCYPLLSLAIPCYPLLSLAVLVSCCPLLSFALLCFSFLWRMPDPISVDTALVHVV